MPSLQRPLAALTGLAILASGFTMTAPLASHAAGSPTSAEQHHGEEAGAPRTDHTFDDTATDFPVRANPEAPNSAELDHDQGKLANDGLVGAAAQGPLAGDPRFTLSRRGDFKVKLVTVKLADNKGTVNTAAAAGSINYTSNYWKRMSNGRISMSVASTKWGHVSKAKSTWSQTDIMNQVTTELGWKYSPNTALVVFIPAKTLANGTVGYGWSSAGTSGRVLMPQISSNTTSVMAHEFGHVLGVMHADALQCTKGQQDIKAFANSGCHIKEYGDTMDVMGAAVPNKAPAISASIYDYSGMGRGDDIRNLGYVTGTKTWTLYPWAGTAPKRALKFKDAWTDETYYIEFRAPVSYDANSALNGNHGIKITQNGGATGASSLILMPSTKPFSGYYSARHAWKPGQTFTTHGGTKVKINSLNGSSSASITIIAPSMPGRVLTDMDRDGTADIIARDSAGKLWLYPTKSGGGFSPRKQVHRDWSTSTAILQPGDFNGDKRGDLISRDDKGGLFFHRGAGDGTYYLSPVQIGKGWQNMTAFITPGDFNRDGHVDLIARDSAGKLLLYPGNGKGTFGTRVQIGTGWAGFTSIFSAGDFNGDGTADVMARDTSGNLFLYRGNGKNAFSSRAQIGKGWNSLTAFSGPGTWGGGDRFADVLARSTSGEMFVYRGNGTGKFLGSTRIGSGWNAMSIAPLITPMPAPQPTPTPVPSPTPTR